MADDVTTEQPMQDRPKAPVELRTASVGDVNFAQRLVTLVVTPYEQPTHVMWQGEVWEEMFERCAWDGLEKRPGRVKANRDHNKSRTVGKAMRFFPSRQEGLVAEIRVAQTPLGDETLALCEERCVGASAGFAALPDDQAIDRQSRTRRIKKAFLDHISFVEDPAYAGAEVLEVRENQLILPDEIAAEPAFRGPTVAELMNDPVYLWAKDRIGGC
jgi:phage head maturation protease